MFFKKITKKLVIYPVFKPNSCYLTHLREYNNYYIPLNAYIFVIVLKEEHNNKEL